jgi:two-component system, sensor histidine kinase
LDNPERDRTKGLGLGLAIVRRLTELLDCKLRLRSQPARGSCFEVAFPLAGDTTGVIELQPQAFSGVLAQGLIIVEQHSECLANSLFGCSVSKDTFHRA